MDVICLISEIGECCFGEFFVFEQHVSAYSPSESVPKKQLFWKIDELRSEKGTVFSVSYCFHEPNFYEKTCVNKLVYEPKIKRFDGLVTTRDGIILLK